MEKTQTLKDGSKAIFLFQGMKEDFLDNLMTQEQLDTREGLIVTVLSLETYTELGEKDYEYYNIRFPDGTEEEGMSGYHLDPVKEILTEVNPDIRKAANDIDGKCNQFLELISDLDLEGTIDLSDDPELESLKEALGEVNERVTNWQEARGLI